MASSSLVALHQGNTVAVSQFRGFILLRLNFKIGNKAERISEASPYVAKNTAFLLTNLEDIISVFFVALSICDPLNYLMFFR